MGHKEHNIYFTPFSLNWTFPVDWDSSDSIALAIDHFSFFFFPQCTYGTIQGWHLTKVPESSKGAVTGWAECISNLRLPGHGRGARVCEFSLRSNGISSSWPWTIAQWLVSMGCLEGYDVFSSGKREESSKVTGDSKLSIMRECGLPGTCTSSRVYNSTVLQIGSVFLMCLKSVAVPC